MSRVGCVTAAVEEISVPPGVAAYCRQARRLRGRLARQPARMHRELRELGAARGPADAVTVRPVTDRSGVRAFAERVAEVLEGPVLRYANRRGLLRQARRLGIGDFEANLIIAAVQHERRRSGDLVEPPSEVSPAQRGWSAAPLLVVLAVEALVVLGAWQIVTG